jgi:hypothetical protein
MTVRYTNTLKIDFGRKVSAAEANEQFEEIEKAMRGLESLAEQIQSPDTEIHNYGSVDDLTVLDPAFGNMQKLTVESLINLDFIDPQSDDPNVIYLLIGGSGSFKFPDGTAWSTTSFGTTVSGKPWDSDGLGGDYGAMVICIYDGLGWLYMVFGRNNIDFTASMSVADLYRWR